MAAGAGCNVTDWEISEHHFKLGRVLWAIGGESKADPEQVRLPSQKHIKLSSLLTVTCMLGASQRDAAVAAPA